MKLTYDTTNRKDSKQLRSLTLHLLQTRKGEVLSGIKARRFFSELYGLDIDHHVWAETLDYMSRIDCARVVACNGETDYIIS